MKRFLSGSLIFILLIAILPKTSGSSAHDNNKEVIKIGFLISSGKSVEALNGAKLAILKLNRKTADIDQPFELVVRSMEGPWGTGSKQAVDLIFEEKVVALIGSHDGRNAHLVEQAAAKSRTVFLSAWASDPTLSQAFVPWYFSIVPNDIQQASALIREIYGKTSKKSIVVVSDNGYDSKQASSNFVKMAGSDGKTDPLVLTYDNSGSDLSDLFNQIMKYDAEAVVLFGESSASAGLIKQMRLKKMKQPLFSSVNILGERVTDKGDISDFEGVTLPSCDLWFNSGGNDFRREYSELYGTEPGPAAAYAFDAVNLIAEAVINAGTDYKLIEGWLQKAKYEGATGMISFDEKGNRNSEIQMMIIKNGIPKLLERQ